MSLTRIKIKMIMRANFNSDQNNADNLLNNPMYLDVEFKSNKAQLILTMDKFALLIPYTNPLI